MGGMADSSKEGIQNKKLSRFVMRCNDDKESRSKPYKTLTAPVPMKKLMPNHFDYIFFNEYLRDCAVDLACVVDLVAASNHGNDEYVRHYLHPGTVYMLPASPKKPRSWLVKDVMRLFDKYNASTEDFILVHVSDETLHFNHPNLIEFYYKWKKVYRQTWHITKEYTALSQVGKLDWVPITHLRTPNLTASQMLPASKRAYNMTFRGNMATNFRRLLHWRELQQWFRKRNSSMTGRVFKSGAFSTDPSGGGYLSEMCNSRLCLGLKGVSPECHRFYESLECGCIPVFIDDYIHKSYKSAFRPWKTKLMEVEWRKGHSLPFIWAKNVSSFMETYDSLMLSGQEGLQRLDNMQKETMEWWAAAKKHFKDRFESVYCSFRY